jgi:hypothetical protein
MDGDSTLHINSVVRAANAGTTGIEGLSRIIAIHENFAYLMRLDVHPLRAPYKYHLQSIMKELESGQITVIDTVEMNLPLTWGQLNASAQTRLSKTLEMLHPLLFDRKSLHDEFHRGRMIRQIADSTGNNPATIRRLFFRWLWGGQTELSLCSYIRYQPTSQQKGKTAKRGPVPKSQGPHCRLPLPDVKGLLEKGANEFYLKGAHTLKEAYVLTLSYNFSSGIQIRTANSISAPQIDAILPQSHERPTLRQFRYVCEQLVEKNGKRIKKPRKMRPEDIEENRKGTVRDDVHGPGYRFEIDSTQLQIQLVSSFSRSRLVGSPTLYLVIDVWSGAIVGYFLSLEHSSWSLAAQALLNTFHDKGNVFKRLKLQYTSEDWPCHHLPSHLTADRAEFLSDKSERFPYTGVNVQVMPPMRPELKPLVERAFAEAKHGHFFNIPGRYPKFRKRREPDGKNEAVLTVHELEQVIVEIIMGINNEPQCRKNIPLEMLCEDKPDVTRIGLYTWGLRHRQGYTRILSQRDVRTYLLMQGKASLRPNGIYYEGRRYFSQRLMESNLISQAASRKEFQIEIRYDEHMACVVWFIDNGEWVEAFIDDDEVIKRQLTFAELKLLNATADRLVDEAKTRNILHKDKSRNGFNRSIRKVKDESSVGVPKRPKTKLKIRENAALEQDLARAQRGIDYLAKNFPERLQPQISVIPADISDQGNSHHHERSIVQLAMAFWDRI